MNTINLSQLSELAKRAYYGTSFSPEKRGQQMISEYEALLAEDLSTIEAASDDTKKLYTQRFIAHLTKYIAAKSRVVSPMISGPSNFPVRQQEKYRNWEHSAYEKFSEFRNKALNGIKKQIQNEKPSHEIDAEAWKSIESKILWDAAAIMDIDNKTGTGSRALFVSNLTGFIQRLAKNGQTDHVKKALELIQQLNTKHTKPIVTERNSIFKLIETAQAIEETKRDQSLKESETYTFEGGVVVLNYQENRLQIKHDSKPDQSILDTLKRKAFKWSPTNKAWQLFLHNQAICKANELLNIQIPYLNK